MTAPSSERLAKALDAAGLHDLALRARADEFHDYLSPHTFPEMTLDNELNKVGEAGALIRLALHNGQWDATKQESDEWAASPEGQEIFRQLMRKPMK